MNKNVRHMLLAILLGLLAASCSRTGDRPNVLFVVWDTVRVDRLSLYGCEIATTPFLDTFARGARVFDNCTSTGSSTVPSHGAMFTGLLPREHGANGSFNHLADQHETLAEIFKADGYATYLFSANPHISSDENFCQGIDVEEHPWNKRFRNALRAMAIRDGSRPSGRVSVKNTGKLAEIGLLDWLGKIGEDKPFFAFLNYMEAHQPFAPSIDIRRRLMTPEQLQRLEGLDRSWTRMWSYSFGLHEYTAADLEILSRLYDGCIIELDRLFKELIASLEAGGFLENTIVVLVSDHGEHLGEHHLLDHQYSLYEPLLRVPLVIHYPGKVTPGREARPVVNYDLFPTLLELAGLDPPSGLPSHSRSLLEPREDRLRIAEYPSEFDRPIDSVKKIHRDWDPTPFRRTMTALYEGKFKYIRASDGADELYDLSVDPGEERNLVGSGSEDTRRFRETLERFMNGLVPFDYSTADGPQLSDEQIQRLRALGYGGGRR